MTLMSISYALRRANLSSANSYLSKHRMNCTHRANTRESISESEDRRGSGQTQESIASGRNANEVIHRKRTELFGAGIKAVLPYLRHRRPARTHRMLRSLKRIFVPSIR